MQHWETKSAFCVKKKYNMVKTNHCFVIKSLYYSSTIIAIDSFHRLAFQQITVQAMFLFKLVGSHSPVSRHFSIFSNFGARVLWWNQVLIATDRFSRPLYQASSLSLSFIVIGVEHGVFNLETQIIIHQMKQRWKSTWGTENSFILAKHPVKEAWLSLLHLIWPWCKNWNAKLCLCSSCMRERWKNWLQERLTDTST